MSHVERIPPPAKDEFRNTKDSESGLSKIEITPLVSSLDNNTATTIPALEFTDSPSAPPTLHLTLPQTFKYLLVVLLCFANFLDIISYQIALPGRFDMQNELKMSIPLSAWYLDAPAMGIAATSLVGGRLADVFGAKWVFIAGGILFAGSSLGGALSHTSAQCLLFRGLQGAGTGIQVPAALRAMMQINPTSNEQRIAISLWSGCQALATALGAPLGAVLCAIPGKWGGWRGQYWLLTGSSAIVVVAGFWIPYLPKPRTEDRPGMDIVGLILVIGGLLCFVLDIINAGIIHNFRSLPVILPLCLSLPLILLFIYHERCIPPPPTWSSTSETPHISPERDCLIPPSTWRIRNFGVLMLASTPLYASWTAITFAIMVYWREVFGYGAFEVALHILPLGIAGGAVALYATFYQSHFLGENSSPRVRRLISGALVMVTLAMILASFSDSAGKKFWYTQFLAEVICPMGTVILQVCTYSGLLQSCPTSMSGVVSAMQQGFLQVSVSVSTALYALIQAEVNQRQAEGSGSFQGIAWADRFVAATFAALLVVFLIFYRVDGRLETRAASERGQVESQNEVGTKREEDRMRASSDKESGV